MSYRADYQEKLKHPKWQKVRLQVLERAGFKCECCEDTEENLHVHHLIYTKSDPWDSPLEHLECLCQTCHAWREDFNYYWDGRSLVSTGLCQDFEWLFKSVFDNKKNPLNKASEVGDLYRTAHRLKFPNRKITPSIQPKSADTLDGNNKGHGPDMTANTAVPNVDKTPDRLSEEQHSDQLQAIAG